MCVQCPRAAVEDYWVFEHPLKKQVSNKWRLAARLAIPQPKKLNEGGPEAAGQQAQQAQQ